MFHIDRTYSIARYLMVFGLVILSVSSFAQQTLDKVVAVVGRNKIILRSEVQMRLSQILQQETVPYDDSMECDILQQMILEKLLVEQAVRDSVIVSEEEVEANLENRVRYFISLYGSKEKLEQASGKTIYQMKEENRETIRENMMAERIQGQILQDIKITPAEVTAFFNNIPVDSLPFFPAMVEMGQIVIEPGVSPELDQYARKKLEDIRKQIVDDGKNFEVMAGIYSQDPGSRDNGGDIGLVGRTDVVPEFAAAAFRLKNGEVSPIVKTKFGYHIIQMIARQGEQAHLRHILIKPERTSVDFNKALNKLDSVRSQLIAGTITFQEAVGKYATDDMSKRTGGMIVDQNTGSSQLEIDKLDPQLALMVDTLKPGMYSQPQIFDQGGGDKATRIVYMKNITTPHKANLKDDYNRIQETALQQKRAKKMETWLAEKSPSYYIKIDPAYMRCNSLQMWSNNSSVNK